MPQLRSQALLSSRSTSTPAFRQKRIAENRKHGANSEIPSLKGDSSSHVALSKERSIANAATKSKEKAKSKEKVTSPLLVRSSRNRKTSNARGRKVKTTVPVDPYEFVEAHSDEEKENRASQSQNREQHRPSVKRLSGFALINEPLTRAKRSSISQKKEIADAQRIRGASATIFLPIGGTGLQRISGLYPPTTSLPVNITPSHLINRFPAASTPAFTFTHANTNAVTNVKPLPGNMLHLSSVNMSTTAALEAEPVVQVAPISQNVPSHTQAEDVTHPVPDDLYNNSPEIAQSSRENTDDSTLSISKKDRRSNEVKEEAYRTWLEEFNAQLEQYESFQLSVVENDKSG